jgi:hypothetical protein
MDFIPGKNEALVRAHLMRDLYRDGVDVPAIARYFGYQVSTVLLMICWHEKLYPVIPDVDETGYPHLLDQFRLNRPSPG